LKLAKNFIKRKDYQTGAFLILLYGLSAIKSGINLLDIRNEVNSNLESFGISKKFVEETFYVSVLLLILEIHIKNIRKYKSKIKNFLETLPIFEEENVLININDPK
jgi:hypothetical protein